MKKLNITPEEMKVRKNKQGLEFYHRNKEQVKLYKQKYRKENSEKFKQQRHESYLRTKEHVLQKSKEDYIKNRERALAYAKSRHLEPGFKESKAAYSRKWTAENKEYQRQKTNVYAKERRKTDKRYRLVLKLRSMIHHALRRQNAPKSQKTYELLGCNDETFKEYIQSKFTEGMSWENRGFRTWHIDHIIPINSFDLTDPEQQRKCFHYTNLQPLWWLDNLRKGDRLPDELGNTIKRKYTLNRDLMYRPKEN